MRRLRGTAICVVLCFLLVLPVVRTGFGAPASTIVIGNSSEFVNPDPAYNTFLNDLNLLYVNMFDALVVRRPDGSLGPQLATSWRLVNPTTWEFKLRQGVRFQNGESFNAEAVKGTVDRFLEPGKQRAPFIAKQIAAAKVIDEYTVQITTPKPDPVFLENTIYFMYLIPPKYYQKVGDDGFGLRPIGTGPFQFVSWNKGSSVMLAANPNYWKGRPKIQNVEIRLIPEIATRIAALRAGEIDIAMQLTPDQIPLIKADANLRATGAKIPRIIYLITWSGGPGDGGASLKDRRVRQALNYAINVDSIIKNLLANQAVRSATIVPPLAFGFDSSVAAYPYDPQKAKQLLAQAGYANGFTVDFDVPSGGNPLKPAEVGQAIVADLSKVGITARLHVVEGASYVGRRNDRKLSPIFMWNWYGYDADLPVWGNAHPDFPFSFYNNPDVVKLIDEEKSTLDKQRRLAAFKRIEQIFKDDAPFVALYQQNDIYGVNRRIDWSAKPGGHVFLWDTAIVR